MSFNGKLLRLARSILLSQIQPTFAALQFYPLLAPNVGDDEIPQSEPHS